MTLTANHKTVVAIRTLIEYLEDEREDYQEQLERGEGDGHIYEVIAQIEKWLSGQARVLHMVANSDIDSGLPQADCEVLTAQEAAERFQAMLEIQQLSPIPYNPETDKVLARYETSDAGGHRFYGFAPLGEETPDGYTELTYAQTFNPLGGWQVKVNDVVVYQQQEEEDAEDTDDGEPGSGEEECASVPVEATP